MKYNFLFIFRYIFENPTSTGSSDHERIQEERRQVKVREFFLDKENGIFKRDSHKLEKFRQLLRKEGTTFSSHQQSMRYLEKTLFGNDTDEIKLDAVSTLPILN